MTGEGTRRGERTKETIMVGVSAMGLDGTMIEHLEGILKIARNASTLYGVQRGKVEGDNRTCDIPILGFGIICYILCFENRVFDQRVRGDWREIRMFRGSWTEWGGEDGAPS